MSHSLDAAASQPTIRIRPNLLERLKDNAGIRTDDAFARTIGISRATLDRLRMGGEPNLRTVIQIAQTFGLGLGEVVVSENAASEHVAVAS
ncbi:helix-turn-helix domain-containing protein [Microbacterium jejuense]|uniref:Helix-turn-helix domain-containing protein n=1 Tax=Microbacterium jejuense TaxID=1263637 RepID=A0ABS7HL30_9MICO|nr:helix-turn-helix transcriptional regulator [Microbacterium jejuense]MBW9093150.1 helix-turn-helix domain-containing protein [Microbacterium jejuense]